jgi:hypothetical protein
VLVSKAINCLHSDEGVCSKGSQYADIEKQQEPFTCYQSWLHLDSWPFFHGAGMWHQQSACVILKDQNLYHQSIKDTWGFQSINCLNIMSLPGFKKDKARELRFVNQLWGHTSFNLSALLYALTQRAVDGCLLV